MPKLFLCLTVLLIGTLYGHPSEAREIIFCNTCYSESEFKTYAEGATHDRLNGTYDFEVINYGAEILYEVTVIKEYDYESDQMLILYSSASPVSASRKQDFLDVKGVFENQDEYIVELTPGTGSNSFDGYQPEVVNGQIAAQSWFKQLSASELLSFAVASLKGDFPIVIVVFANGDVAKWRVLKIDQASLCCEYKAGSARDEDGLFLNDSGLGGSGTSDGSGYVQDYDEPGHYTVKVRAGTQWYICGPDGNGGYGCVRL